MDLSSYMFNLFMTVIILLFMLIGYLYYQITFTYKETFQNMNTIIDLSGAVNIPGFNPEININEAIQNLQAADLSGSTAYRRDILLNNQTQCNMINNQKNELEKRIETYRSQGDFTNLRISYEIIESLNDYMKKNNCVNE